MTQTAIIDFHDPGAIQKANQIIKGGGTIAFPTDTVYGLAADVFENDAIRKIYAIKERSMLKALPVLIANMGQLERIISEMKESAKILAEAYWPGPLTLILPKGPSLPELLSPYSTIGVRMPNYPLTLELLETTGPLATTSANLSGESNPRTAQDVLDQLGGRIDLLLDGGETPGVTPSTVVEITTSEIRILREGPISKSNIKALIDKDLL